MKKFMTLKIFKEFQTKAQEFRSESLSDRLSRLDRLQTWIKKNTHLIEKSLDQDFKKPAFETQTTEILTVLSELKYYKTYLAKWAKDKKVPTPISLAGHTSRIRFEPKGVVLIISPWNYPFQLAVIPLISALAAGNSVILKPSELTVSTSELLKRMCKDCFAEDEVLVELGDKLKTNELLNYNFNHVFFTGSAAVGRIIAVKCAEKLIPYTLELGGKSPAIIDQTADIKDAVKKIHWTKFSNRGQTCVAPDVLIVHKKIKDEFMFEYKKLENSLSGEKSSQIINEKNLIRLQNMCKDQVNLGSVHTHLIESKFKPNELALNSESLLNVNLKNKLPLIHTEEIFGPLALVYEFENFEDIEIIYNLNPDPLALYIFSENREQINKVLKHFPSGGVGINTVVVHLANLNLPFGGIGQSGHGQYHGHFGFLEFSHQRAVLEQNLLSSSIEVLLPPYTNVKKRFIQILIKVTT